MIMRKAKYAFAYLLTCTIFSVVLISCGDDKSKTETVTESVKTDTLAPVVVDTMKIDTATPMPVKPVN